MDRKPCPMRDGADCWECITAYREMIGRMATGATVHALNNKLLTMYFACCTDDREAYRASLREFLELCKAKIPDTNSE